jgi:hypothetical protein
VTGWNAAQLVARGVFASEAEAQECIDFPTASGAASAGSLSRISHPPIHSCARGRWDEAPGDFPTHNTSAGAVDAFAPAVHLEDAAGTAPAGLLCPICLLLSGERVTRSGLVQVRFCAVHAEDSLKP